MDAFSARSGRHKPREVGLRVWPGDWTRFFWVMHLIDIFIYICVYKIQTKHAKGAIFVSYSLHMLLRYFKVL